MDPLSLAASVIAVVGAAQKTAKTIARLVALSGAPDELARSFNEVSELRILLVIVADTARQAPPQDEAVVERFNNLLKRATAGMKDLVDLIKFRLIKDPESLEDETKPIEVRWTTWLREESKLLRLTANLAEIRHALTAALSALSALELSRVRVSLREIASVNHVMNESVQRLEYNTGHRLDNLTSSIVSYTQTQQTDWVRETGTWERPQIEDGGATEITEQTQLEIEVRYGSNKQRKCTCRSQAPLATKTPMWLGGAVGLLLLKYNPAKPKPCPACEDETWSGHQSFKMSYFFPTWMARSMMHVHYTYSPFYGHNVSLKTIRTVSKNADIFSFAQHGNVEGMRRLFELKLASPLDVSLEEGRSALHHAVTAFEPKIWEFLISQGADAHLEDHHNLSAQDLVWNYHLQTFGGEKHKVFMRLAGLSGADTEALEKRGFSSVHSIVLGLSDIPLDKYLDLSVVDLDSRDVLGKTPLCWAASRQDTSVVDTLLSYGAATHIASRKGQTPVHYAAGGGTAGSLRLLLNKALGPNEEEPNAARVSAAEASTIIDAVDNKGRTPLNFAIRMDFPEHTQVLIEHGANMECTDGFWQRTILLNAIYWNCHKVIPILLTSGASTDALDVRNATILHHAARYSNLETLKILADHNLGLLDINVKDDSGHTAWEIFESAELRCVVESAETRTQSLKAFEKIAANVTKSNAKPAHVVEVDDSDADSFYDAVSEHMMEKSVSSILEEDVTTPISNGKIPIFGT